MSKYLDPIAKRPVTPRVEFHHHLRHGVGFLLRCVLRLRKLPIETGDRVKYPPLFKKHVGVLLHRLACSLLAERYLRLHAAVAESAWGESWSDVVYPMVCRSFL